MYFFGFPSAQQMQMMLMMMPASMTTMTHLLLLLMMIHVQLLTTLLVGVQEGSLLLRLLQKNIEMLIMDESQYQLTLHRDGGVHCVMTVLNPPFPGGARSIPIIG